LFVSNAFVCLSCLLSDPVVPKVPHVYWNTSRHRSRFYCRNFSW